MSERTLQDAMQNAERLRQELPHLIQPTNSDRDMVRLADEVDRLRARVAEFEVLGRQIIAARDHCAPRYRCPADLDGAIGAVRLALREGDSHG